MPRVLRILLDLAEIHLDPHPDVYGLTILVTRNKFPRAYSRYGVFVQTQPKASDHFYVAGLAIGSHHNLQQYFPFEYGIAGFLGILWLNLVKETWRTDARANAVNGFGILRHERA